jgi:hypothetical protein
MLVISEYKSGDSVHSKKKNMYSNHGTMLENKPNQHEISPEMKKIKVSTQQEKQQVDRMSFLLDRYKSNLFVNDNTKTCTSTLTSAIFYLKFD